MFGFFWPLEDRIFRLQRVELEVRFAMAGSNSTSASTSAETDPEFDPKIDFDPHPQKRLKPGRGTQEIEALDRFGNRIVGFSNPADFRIGNRRFWGSKRPQTCPEPIKSGGVLRAPTLLMGSGPVWGRLDPPTSTISGPETGRI